MNPGGLQAIVSRLGRWRGMQGVALVDVGTGMVWFHAGAWPGLERIGEAAVEFWRLQQRLAGPLAALGPLQSLACAFADRVVALFPCARDPLLVLVCIADKAAVAWSQWAGEVEHLKRALAAQGAARAAAAPTPSIAGPVPSAAGPAEQPGGVEDREK